MTRWFGHDAQLAELIAAQQSDRLHHGWIFAGPRGIGKAGIALDFAARLLSDPAMLGDVPERFTPPESSTKRLIDNGTHPDFALLRRIEKEGKGDATTLARNISVDQIRGLSRLLNGASSMGGQRVVMIDAADDLEAGGANALLKNLEEPPAGAIFLLVAHAPGRLLPTIRSRCRVLRFDPLDDAAMMAALENVVPHRSTEERSRLVRAAQGAPGRAIALADLALDALEEALEAIAQGGGRADEARARLVQQLSLVAARPRLEAFVDMVPHFISARARKREGASLGAALRAYDEARRLGEGAITPLQLEPGALVRMLCDTVAGLAPRR